MPTEDLLMAVFQNFVKQGMEHLVKHFEADSLTVFTPVEFRLDFTVDIRVEQENKKFRCLFGVPVKFTDGDSLLEQLKQASLMKVEFNPKHVEEIPNTHLKTCPRCTSAKIDRTKCLCLACRHHWESTEELLRGGIAAALRR